MKVAIATAHDAGYTELASITLPTLVDYAAKHAYKLYYQPDIPENEKDLCKARIFFELLASGEYSRDDFYAWIDTDAVIMNQDIRVENVWNTYASEDTHFLWSYNWDGPNSGVWIARFTSEAAAFIRAYTFEQTAMGWGDNNAMNQKMLFPPFNQWIKCIPGRVMNAAPYAEYGLGEEAHRDSINNYNPGDWIIHLPGMESSRRMELLRKYTGREEVALAPHPLGEGPADWPVVRGLAEAMKTPRGVHECTDWAIWHAVYHNNEYELKEDFKPEDVVIDIGMQSGSFTCLAYTRGSRNILGFEVDTDSFLIAEKNVRYLTASDDIQIFNKAVTGNDRPEQFYKPGSMQTNADGEGVRAQTIAFDDILAPLKKVRYLKIDVEGAEWPILLTSQQLHKIQEIGGEYHCSDVAVSRDIPKEKRTVQALEAFLKSHQFNVRIKECTEDSGNFWAWR